MDKELEKRKIIVLLKEEVEDILDGDHYEFIQVESNHEVGDIYNLIFKNKLDEYFQTTYYENINEGIYHQQSFAEQVFPKERKVTIIVYE